MINQTTSLRTMQHTVPFVNEVVQLPYTVMYREPKQTNQLPSHDSVNRLIQNIDLDQLQRNIFKNMEIKNQRFKSSDSDFFDFGYYSREISSYLQKKAMQVQIGTDKPLRRIHLICNSQKSSSRTVLQKRSYHDSSCSDVATDYSLPSALSQRIQNPRIIKQMDKTIIKPASHFSTMHMGQNSHESNLHELYQRGLSLNNLAPVGTLVDGR